MSAHNPLCIYLRVGVRSQSLPPYPCPSPSQTNKEENKRIGVRSQSLTPTPPSPSQQTKKRIGFRSQDGTGVILHSVDTTQQRKLRGAELEGTAETPNEIKLIDVVGSSFFELFGGRNPSHCRLRCPSGPPEAGEISPLALGASTLAIPVYIYIYTYIYLYIYTYIYNMYIDIDTERVLWSADCERALWSVVWERALWSAV